MDSSAASSVPEQQAAAGAGDPSAADAPTAPSSGSSPALAVEVPAAPEQPAAAQEVEAGVEDEAPASSGPASPLNIHSLLNRPFGDVLREIASGLQLRSTAHVAAEQLRYLVFHRDHDSELLGSPQVMALMLQQVRDGPGLPASGSCMWVLAQLARSPTGRAQLRAQGVLQPVLRFLSLPDAVSRANAEAATLLLQNLSADKPSRQAMVKAGCIELLLSLLGANNPLALKQQAPKVAAHITGCLVNLVAGDPDSSAAKHLFVKAGGMDTGCKVLAGWGRYDTSPATLRLRLLLTDLGKLQQYSSKLHQTALDASCPSARAQADPNAATAAAGVGAPSSGAGQLGSARGAAAVGVAGALAPVDLGVVTPGKGVVLGTMSMPASDRLTVAVLEHGKANHDGSAAGDAAVEE